MEGCRVYRHTYPPRDWRKRLSLAREIVARCAPETPPPMLSLRGREAATLEDLSTSGLRVTDATLWGYVRPDGFAAVGARVADWLRGGASVYLALDYYDASGWLHSGARAYCNPDPAKSTLMLTVPPHDRGEAKRLLEGMLVAAHAAGLFPEPLGAAAAAESLLAETKESVPLAGLEVRPIRTGDHPHMLRLAGDRGTSERLLAALEGCRHVLGPPSRIYLKLQGPVNSASAADEVPFESAPLWRARAELPPDPEVDRHLATFTAASATFAPLRFGGQAAGPLSEMVVGLSRPLLTVTVDFQQDGDAVERALLEACPALERVADMPFE